MGIVTQFLAVTSRISDQDLLKLKQFVNAEHDRRIKSESVGRIGVEGRS